RLASLIIAYEEALLLIDPTELPIPEAAELSVVLMTRLLPSLAIGLSARAAGASIYAVECSNNCKRVCMLARMAHTAPSLVTACPCAIAVEGCALFSTSSHELSTSTNNIIGVIFKSLIIIFYISY